MNIMNIDSSDLAHPSVVLMSAVIVELWWMIWQHMASAAVSVKADIPAMQLSTASSRGH